MEEVTEKKGRGGARAGSGRKRSPFLRQCRTVYCSSDELKLLKAVLHEIRRSDAAQVAFTKAIKENSDETEKRVLLNSYLSTKNDAREKTLAQLIEESGAITLK